MVWWTIPPHLQWRCVVLPCRTFSLLDGVVFLLDLSQVGPHADERLDGSGSFVLCQLFCLLLAVLPFSIFQGTTFCCCCFFLAFFGAEVSIAHPRIVGFFAIQHVWSSDYAIALLCESNCKYRHPAESRLFLASCRALGKLVTFWLTNGWQSGRRSECLKASLVPSILTFASRVVVVYFILGFVFCCFYFLLLAREWRIEEKEAPLTSWRNVRHVVPRTMLLGWKATPCL